MRKATPCNQGDGGSLKNAKKFSEKLNGAKLKNQTFSAKNFRYISESEKRKGKVKDLEFFPNVKIQTDILRERIAEAKHFRRTHTGKYSEADQAIFDEIKTRREDARAERDEVLLNELENVAKRIVKRSFRVTFSKFDGPNGKAVYSLPEGCADSYYALKNLDKNVNSLYKVSPENRNTVIGQLASFISDDFPYHIIKTDIKGFFEEIPHAGIIEKLKNDQLLSQTSLRIVSQVLHTYGTLSNTSGVGLPRGLSLSSYLSELYMRDFDNYAKSLDDIVFYARYVDDIIAIFAPSPGTDSRIYIKKLEYKINEKSLSLNHLKTLQSPVDAKGNPGTRAGWEFDYLGYRFQFGNKLAIKLSKKRLDRYKNRIDASFIRYKSQSAKDAKGAYRLLVKRIRFLTGNTQLSHNKRNAYVGIYFSNSHINDNSDLKELDIHLRRATARISSASLKSKIGVLSFVDGHQQKIFRRFHRANEFSEIVEAWKYE